MSMQDVISVLCEVLVDKRKREKREVVNVFFMCSKTKEKDNAVFDGKPLRNFVNESNLSAFVLLIKKFFFSQYRS